MIRRCWAPASSSTVRSKTSEWERMERQRQWHTDKRKFKTSWQYDYLFTEIDSTAVCLVCKQKVAGLKEYNIHRHYETKHSHQSAKYTGEDRKVKVADLLARQTTQRTLLQPSTAQENATRASYRISVSQRWTTFCGGWFCQRVSDNHHWNCVSKSVAGFFPD